MTHVLGRFQNNSMENKVDWLEVRRHVFAAAAWVKTTADIYDAIDLT
ncbi:hypothetical protein AB0G42_29195 [Streptomyces yangpuensis]